MRKISNWLFGSFFRTIGRVIAFIAIGLFLSYIINFKDLFKKINLDWLIMNLNAENITGWGINFDNGGSGLWYDCNGSNNCTTRKTLTDLTDFSVNRTYLVGNAYGTIATNGMALTYRYPIVHNQLYNVQIGFCSNTNLSDVFASKSNYSIYPGSLTNAGQSYLKSNKYLDWYRVDNYPFSINREIGSYCYIVTSYIVSNDDTNAVILRLKNSGSSITGFTPALIGYNITSMGLYDERIEEIVNRSGIATAQSVEQVQNSVNYVQNEIENTNDFLNNDDTTQSTNEASSFFNSFNTDTHGLTSVITAPLNAIQSLTSKTCSPLVLPIPFLNNKNLSLPCMRNIYDEFFGDFMIIYDVITLGIISYWILVRIFNLVKDFKNPGHDEIEVMDL